MKKAFMLTLILVSLFLQASSTPWEGYIDAWGNYVPGLITNDTWMTPMPEYVSGKMVFYGPYAMDATAEYREIDYEEEGCIGGISLMSPYNIGDKAWIKVNNKWYGPYCVVDCAKRGDMYSIVVYREEVVEINFELAVKLGMVSQHINGNYEVYDWFMDVEVLVNNSPYNYDFKEDPVFYKEYFLNTLEFATGYEPRVLVLDENTWKEYGREKYWVKETLDKYDNIWYNVFVIPEGKCVYIEKDINEDGDNYKNSRIYM
jgi:hypothetical protein